MITLISLIFALSGFGPSEQVNASGGNSAVSRVVVQNAIALSSTVAALGIRTLWVLSLSEDPNLTLEEEAEKHLAASIRLTYQLNKEVQALGKTVKSVRDETLRFAKESRVDFANFASALASKTQDEIGQTFDNLETQLEPIGIASQKFMKDISEIKLDKEALTRAVAEAMRATLDEISGSIGAITTATGHFSTGVAKGTKKITGALETFQFAEILEQKIAENLKPLDGISQKFETVFSESLEKIRSAVSAVDTEVGKFQSALQENIESVGQTNKSADMVHTEILTTGQKLAGAIDAAIERLGGEIGGTELREARQRLISEIDALGEAVAKARSRSWFQRLFGRR